jgi:hypothetical protein
MKQNELDDNDWERCPACGVITDDMLYDPLGEPIMCGICYDNLGADAQVDLYLRGIK